MSFFRISRRHQRLTHFAPITERPGIERRMRIAMQRVKRGKHTARHFAFQQSFDRAVADLVQTTPVSDEISEWFRNEKLIPQKKHLGVFLRLLARSAIGQPITIYSSHFRKPREGQEMHIILVDCGRSRQLGRVDFRDSLKCIKCGGCMNTCPVYRKSGGLSYHNTISGPIGAILAPNLDMKKHADLPFASTLCGSCSNVCPVKINIHDQLYKWRQVIVKEGYAANTKAFSMKAMSVTLSSPDIYTRAGKAGRWWLKHLSFTLNNKFNPWYKQRDMPAAPKESFGEWYAKNKDKNL